MPIVVTRVFQNLCLTLVTVAGLCSTLIVVSLLEFCELQKCRRRKAGYVSCLRFVSTISAYTPIIITEVWLETEETFLWLLARLAPHLMSLASYQLLTHEPADCRLCHHEAYHLPVHGAMLGRGIEIMQYEMEVIASLYYARYYRLPATYVLLAKSLNVPPLALNSSWQHSGNLIDYECPRGHTSQATNHPKSAPFCPLAQIMGE